MAYYQYVAKAAQTSANLKKPRALPSHGRGHRFNPYTAHHSNQKLTIKTRRSRRPDASQLWEHGRAAIR